MLGNSKLFYDLKEKNIMNADEQLLLFKIVNEYKTVKI